MESEVKFKVEGELLLLGQPIEEEPNHELGWDWLSQVKWRTIDWSEVFIKDMNDNHLRNAALFLMGMGYRKCYMNERKRIIYLRIFRMEWERRLAARKIEGEGLVKRG